MSAIDLHTSRRQASSASAAAAIDDRSDDQTAAPEGRARRSDRPRLRIVVQPVRPSRWAISVMVTAAIAAFAAVGINVARVEGQRRLDSVHTELATEQARTDALRRKESKIQSPAEVVRIATEELGLIPAAAPVAVAAPPQVVAPPATAAPVNAQIAKTPTSKGPTAENAPASSTPTGN